MLFFSTSVVFEEKIVKKNNKKLKTRIEKYIITVAWVCCVDGIIVIIWLVLVFVCVFDGGWCKILERREE